MNILRFPDDAGGDELPPMLETSAVKAFRNDNRIARMDISESSKEDHRFMTRYTRKEAEDFLKKEYIYLQKRVIVPFAIVEDYPFKTKSSDKDVPDAKNSNVDMGMILVMGRLPKWKNIKHQLDESAFIIGEATFIDRGKYDIGTLKPHIALVVHKKYKIIKPIDIRDLFDPIKNEMQNGAPYVIYKEFPKPV